MQLNITELVNLPIKQEPSRFSFYYAAITGDKEDLLPAAGDAMTASGLLRQRLFVNGNSLAKNRSEKNALCKAIHQNILCIAKVSTHLEAQL